jgi:hypothetical protein
MMEYSSLYTRKKTLYYICRYESVWGARSDQSLVEQALGLDFILAAMPNDGSSTALGCSCS